MIKWMALINISRLFKNAIGLPHTELIRFMRSMLFHLGLHYQIIRVMRLLKDSFFFSVISVLYKGNPLSHFRSNFVRLMSYPLDGAICRMKPVVFYTLSLLSVFWESCHNPIILYEYKSTY